MCCRLHVERIGKVDIISCIVSITVAAVLTAALEPASIASWTEHALS